MNEVTCIHVDDQQESIDLLKHLVENELKGIRYLDGFTDPRQAFEAVRRLKPDLVFLDVEMPGINGVELLEQLYREHRFEVVFITGYRDYAIRAFELSAMHYIMKPVTTAHLIDVLNRYKRINTVEEHFEDRIQYMNSNLQSRNNAVTRIFLNTLDTIHLIKTDDLVRLSSESNYTKFFLADDRELLSSRNLKYYEDALLYNREFLRCHRSHIINIHFVKSITKDKNTWFAEMKNEQRVEVSPLKKDELVALLKFI